MKHFLPARPLLLSLLLVVLAVLARPALATHLLGGELTYRYLDADGPDAAPLRYEITVTVYNNCLQSSNPTDPYPTADVAIYDALSGTKLNLTTANYATVSGGTLSIPSLIPVPNLVCVSPTIPVGCTITGPTQPYKLQKFVATVNLPDNPNGFYAVYSASARNSDITNFANGGGASLELYTKMAPRLIPNRSPVFANVAVAIICATDTTFYLNNAIDADGDRLEYSFGRPVGSGLMSTFTAVPVAYAATGANGVYAATTPFGNAAGRVSTLNPLTGIASFATPVSGKYVVAVDVNEYRVINGQEQLIGSTRRDVQLVVAVCPPTASPKLPTAAAGLPRNYTITAGSSQTIPITATQSDGHPLTMTVTSELLDGQGGYDATFNGSTGTVNGSLGSATATGAAGTVGGQFVYNAACNAVRTAPYEVVVSVADNGCAGKTIFDIFRITVVSPTGPTAIAGDATACVGATSSYAASGGNATAVTWTVTGGTIVGSNTANPVQVRWTTPGAGTISAQGISNACSANLLNKTVTVLPIPTLTVTGPRAVCPGSSSSITVAGSAGAVYTVTGGPVTGSGTSFVLTPTQTTTYTIASAATAANCAGSTQVTITVNPAAAANVGTGPRATCSSSALTLGAAAVAGSTYQWSPATGLSSATVANPTVTLTNTTGAPLTQTYTLTETTSAGCSATNSVTVTINPTIVATPGPARTTCSGTPVSIGTTAVAGYTYSWSPSTGLSSATVANPTVTLTNTSGAATTTTYTLTATNPATGCSGTATVAVTVNPAVVPNTGGAVTTIGGQPVTIGGAPVAGYTYSWSPSTGLSSPTVANPTVLLTNYTGAPLTQTYTLTTTNTATGCSGTATVTVTINVDMSLTIYNVITPNNDGQNDKLFIKNVRSFPGNTLEIYNRWGRQVFATTNYDNDSNYWGTDPGIAPGVYYYLFKQANGNATKGWVEVVK